jgi:hypothetical protein
VATHRNVTSFVNQEALRLLWAIAFDDDDIAGYLFDLALCMLVSKFYSPVEQRYGNERRAVIETLHGQVRAHCVLAQDEVGKRMDTYSVKKEAEEDEIPF